MTSVSIAGLSWQTPSSHALFEDLNLTFGPGRSGLVGRNGTGKTTLPRLIACELTPSKGTITGPSSIGYLKQGADENSDATVANLFGASNQLRILRRAEYGEATTDDLAVADWTLETRLETALKAYDGANVAVSHDQSFLSRIRIERRISL